MEDQEAFDQQLLAEQERDKATIAKWVAARALADEALRELGGSALREQSAQRHSDKHYLRLAYLSFNDIGSYEEYLQSSR